MHNPNHAYAAKQVQIPCVNNFPCQCRTHRFSLQYNSGNSIRNLIQDNESLLSELQIKTKLQKFQTDIIFSETALRDLVNSDDPGGPGIGQRFKKHSKMSFIEIDNTIKVHIGIKIIGST